MIYRLNELSFKIPADILAEIDKLTLIVMWKIKELKIDKSILKKYNGIRKVTLPHFKSYYKARIIKIVYYCIG